MTERAVESSAEVVVNLNEKEPIRVLHVDDESSLLKIAKQCLEMQGSFQVDTASSVEEATEKMKKKKYDAIVSDYQMPNKDGLEFLKELRQAGNAIPFVMFTGKGREEVAIQALNLGADQYLNKVGDPETVHFELAHGIRQAVQRNRAEEGIRRSEEKYRNLFELAPDVLMTLDTRGVITSCNAAALATSGYSRDEIVGKHFSKLDFLCIRDMPKYLTLFASIVRGKVPEPLQVTWHSKDGTPFVSEFHVGLIKEDNKTVGFQVDARDITERKKAEEALRQSEEKYRNLFENAKDVIVLFDLKANITSVNRAAEEYGFNKSEVLGKNMLKFVSRKYWPQLLKDVGQVALGKTAEGRVEIDTPKGDKIAEYRSNPIFSDNRVVGIQTILEDITERREAEETARESEEKWHSLVEMAPDGIATLDVKGVITSVNDAFLNLTGYTREQIVGKHFTKLQTIQPKDAARYLRLMVSALRGKLPRPFEYSYVRKDGTIGWGEAHIGYLKKNGKTIGYQAILREITERKKAEEELRKSEERHKELAESIGDVFFAMDKDLRYTYWNKASERLTGIREKEAIGKTLTEIFPDVKGTPMEQFYLERLRAKKPSTFVNKYNIGGRDYVFDISAYPSRNGLSVFVKDVTDRKRAERELRESEEKFRALAEQSPNMIFINKNGSVVYANKRAEEAMGYTREEFCSLDFDFLTLIAPDSRELIKSGFAKHMKGEDTPPYEYKLVTKQGKVIDVMLSSKLIDYEGEKAILGTVTDTTERKKTEKDASELLHDLNERTKELACLYSISELVEKPGITLKEIMRGIVDLLPPAYQYPNIACARIVFESQEFATENFEETRWKQQADIMVNEEKAGFVQVCYLEEKPAIAEGPFLKEERDLIDATVERLGRIIERVRTQEALKSSEKRLEVLFDEAPDAYYMNDLRGHFIDGNRAAEELTGYRRSELVGKSFLELRLLPRNQIPKAAKLLASNALGKSTGPSEFILNRKDGSQVSVEIRTVPTKIDGKTMVLGIARDVTQRKKNEKMVLESQQRFEGLFTGNPEATVYLDQDFHILDVNPRFTSLFGYPLDEVKGKRLNDVVVPKNYMGEAETLDSKAEQGYVYHDTVRTRKDGSLVFVSVSAAPIFIHGQLAGYIGVYKDISEQKSAEEKLAMMNEKLRVVGGLTRHDARNKLAVVTGNAYLASKELVGNIRVLDYMREIETSVHEVVRIFDFAKAYEMLGAEELTYVDVEKTVNEAISLFSGKRDIKIINDCHGLTVLADSLLRQLLYNLVDNSLKHGQKITKIRAYYERAGQNELKLVYEDDGVGILATEKSKLFKEGYSTGGSTGYGLYLIKKIVEVYGWVIRETGEPGQGARFVMTIPRANRSGKENYRLA
jgi:PAS domain S-box-containing protein